MPQSIYHVGILDGSKDPPLQLSINMRYIYTEYLHPSVLSSLNRSAKKAIRFRPVGLNPEQALEVKLLNERGNKK